MAAEYTHLHGSCACSRNQYTILVPTHSAPQAHVFFDSSAANRLAQATPLTAWLRIPLAWYHSTTYALFPDETHASIRRTFQAPALGDEAVSSPTRRQFCGYCGTHLSAWDERPEEGGGEWLDVTLGSLGSESWDALEALDIIGEGAEDDGQDGGGGDDANEVDMGGVDASEPPAGASRTVTSRKPTTGGAQNRGMPWFEEMTEHSRLGRIRRRRGGHSSRGGRFTVQWEIVELEGEDLPMKQDDADGGSNKRQKLGV